jgi:hypothetical protein
MAKPKQYPFQKTIKKIFPEPRAKALDRRIRILLCDAAVISYPKSGRTWLRSMLTIYCSKIYGTPKDVLYDFANIHSFDPRAPKLFFSHESNYEDSPDSISIDRRRLKKRKIVFVSRDPRDVIVSLYAHRVHRDKTWTGSIEDFIASSQGGFRTALRYYHLWHDFLAEHPDALVLRYEDLHADPAATFEQLLRFLGQPVDREALLETIEETEFSRLKKMESESHFRSGRLKSRQLENPEAFKVRRGKIGGFVKDLRPDVVSQISEAMERELQGAFGYKAGAD